MIMSNSRTTVGAWLCVAALPLFLMAQLLVAAAWRTPCTWSANNISDLGNVGCGPWGDDQRYVCSPLYLVMNTGFVLIGLLIVSGVILLWGSAHLGNRASSLMILLAGCGYVVVGLAPADLHENIHVVVGAIPIFSPAMPRCCSPQSAAGAHALCASLRSCWVRSGSEAPFCSSSAATSASAWEAWNGSQPGHS
jgi:hypothetical membrane protein